MRILCGFFAFFFGAMLSLLFPDVPKEYQMIAIAIIIAGAMAGGD